MVVTGLILDTGCNFHRANRHYVAEEGRGER